MAATIGALRVVLGADTAAFSKGLKQTEGNLSSFAGKAKVAAAAVGVAFAGAATALGVAVRKTLQSADEMAKASQKIGIPVEELSRLRHAADLSGVSFQQLSTAVTRLSRNMSDVSAGAGAQARRAFDELGISVTNVDGTLRSNTEVMGDVAEAFSKMEDGAQKTALATQLFGRAGADLIPMLNQGRDGLQAAAAEADALGITFDTKTAKAAERFNDALTVLSKVWDGFIIQVTAAVAEPLANLAEAFRTSAVEAEGLKNAGQQVGEWAKQAIILFAEMARVIHQLGAAWGVLNQAAERWMNHDFSGSIAALRGLNDEVNRVGQSWDEFIDKLDPAIPHLTFEGMRAELGYTAQAFDPVIAKAGQAAAATKQSADAMGTAAEQVSDNWQGTADSVSGSFGTISSSFNRSGASVAKAGKSFGVAQAIISTFTGMAKALELPFPANIAASAAVAARGFGFVASIKSQNIPSFNQGADFMVGGAGGIDNNLVAFNATRGERVTVTPSDEVGRDRISVAWPGFDPNKFYEGSKLRDLMEKMGGIIDDGGGFGRHRFA